MNLNFFLIIDLLIKWFPEFCFDYSRFFPHQFAACFDLLKNYFCLRIKIPFQKIVKITINFFHKKTPNNLAKNKFVKTYYKQISNYTLIYPFLTMFRYEILCAFTFVVKVNGLILRIQTTSLQGICACCLQQSF